MPQPSLPLRNRGLQCRLLCTSLAVGPSPARDYSAAFPGTRITGIQRALGDCPGGKQGNVLVIECTCMGIPVMGLNGGPEFPQREAFSFRIMTEGQEETDRYWDAIVGSGGQETQCGWCKDKWGVSWQITPRQLTEAQLGPDRAAAKRVFDAMTGMKKIDVAAIEKARRG